MDIAPIFERRLVMQNNQMLFESGKFFTGCNYWASHAGTNMWRDWQPEVIEKDFARLAEADLRVVRLFPRWDDFQPLTMHRAGGGGEREIRLREDPLPFTDAGKAGVDIVMADRFETVCNLAEKYGIRLIVGLITGWMSGRMFAPEAFACRNLLADPLVMRWQIRFVRYMVRRFQKHPAIAAWDLGNECNCMSSVTHDGAFVWTAAISGAVKNEDTSHPLISGLHGNLPDGVWSSQDLAENLDILCTHPYPLFTPHCDTDPMNQMKSCLHAAAETSMYADFGGIPAFVEEAGTLGPMICSEEVAADYVRASAFSCWAHNLRGFVWWCANDQTELAQTPYDWDAVERELGLFRIDGTKKPLVDELSALQKFADNFEYGTLPERIRDAVCILTRGQDVWSAAYGSFLLAKQAGLDITYAWCEDEIPEASSYLLPSVSGYSYISRHVMLELLERVRKGAALYISINDALPSNFTELTGLKVITRSRRISGDRVKLGNDEFHLSSAFKLVLENVNADVLASSEDGCPAFTVRKYGAGQIYCLSYPIETEAANNICVISGANATPYYRFYEKMGLRSENKTAVSASPYLCVTEHVVNENERLLCLINYLPENQMSRIFLKDGWKLSHLISYRGGSTEKAENGFDVTLPENTGAVAVICRG